MCATAQTRPIREQNVARMSTQPFVAEAGSILEAAHRAYAVQAVADESFRRYAEIMRLPSHARLGDDLGITIEGRRRIMRRVRADLGAPAVADPAPSPPATLGELISLVMRMSIGPLMRAAGRVPPEPILVPARSIQ
jgi:hypothetical protein